MQKKFFSLALFSQVIYLSLYFVQYYFNENALPGALILLCILFVIYVISAQISHSKKIHINHVISTAIIFNLSMLFIWNMASDDLFTYIYRSRIFSKYDTNPYLVSYDFFVNDSLYYSLKTIWSSKTGIYGPVFTLLGSAFTAIGGDNLMLNIILFKSVFMSMNIANIYLISKITSNKIAVILYGWNPIIIFDLALNAHNDVVMIFFVLLSILFLTNKPAIKNNVASWFFLLLSVLVKYYGIIFLPFYAIFVLKKNKTKYKIKYIFIIGILSLFTIIFSYFPFWDGFAIFDRLFSLMKSQTIYPSMGIKFLSLVLPFAIAKKICNLLFLIIYISVFVKFMLIKNRLNSELLIKYLLVVLIGFFALCFSLFLPWYTTLLIALVSVYIGFSGDRWRGELLIYISTIYSIILYFVVIL